MPSRPSLRICAAFSGVGSDSAAIHKLAALIGERMQDLDTILAVRQRDGVPAAIALIKKGYGLDAGLAIIDQLSQLRVLEAREHLQATRHWQSSFTRNLWITILGTVLNMLLVAVAARVIFQDLRRRTLLSAELRDQKLHLEREV